MIKAEIISSIAKKSGIEKVDVQAVMEGMMYEIKSSLERGENVYLRGFGTFLIKKRAEKTGRNFAANGLTTTLIIPAHNIPAFKPAKTFANAVKDKVEVE